MQKNYPKKRTLNKLKTSLLLMMMVCFAGVATAQAPVWMREGRTELTDGNTSITFCDSHGPAEASAALDDESGMRVNYWDKWYLAPEQYTHTFIAPNTAPYVKVTFNKYTAFDWSDEGDYQAIPPAWPYNCKSIGEWSLRLNDDWLYVYEGMAVDETKLIGAYTGNSKQEFTIMAQGAMTFRFVSNDLFREEGWQATVKAETSMAPQPPYMRRSTCGDAIELISTTLGATIYYSTDGNNPDPNDILSQNHVYDGTPIPWGSGNLTVSAIARLNDVNSVAARETFTDADRLPNINTDSYKPGLERVAGTNKVKITCPSVPSGLNETFVVYYTDDNTEPSPSNYSMKLIFVNSDIDLEPDGATTLNVHRIRTYEFECTNPNAVFRARVYGFTCQNLVSPMAGPLTFGNILVDDPEISFTTTNQTSGAGTATITCDFTAQTPVIYYTTDGSEPDPANVGQNTPTKVYNGAFAVTAGTTVKAKAVVSLAGYNPSNTVSKMYVPTNASGEPQNGVYGSVVLLDDREPHSWSYYSDGDQPIHSLNPADVKITYLGNGTGTVTTSNNATPGAGTWTQNAAGVQVSYNETANQFVYLKTLERVDGSTSNNPTGRCEYTTIPNPFSKRPTYGNDNTNKWRGFYGWRIKAIRGGKIYSAATDGTQYTAYTSGNLAATNWLSAEGIYYFAPDAETGMEVELEALWARAYVGGSYSSSVSYERNFVIGGGAVNYPATYSALYPNGTTDGTTPATSVSGTYDPNGNRTLNYDSKFEYINLTGGRTFTANNHYLCFGRGISTSNTAAAEVQGINGDVNGNLNYTIRVESGTINKLSFVRDANCTVSGKTQVKAILGCDYDRADGVNTLLKVATNNTLYYARRVTFSSSENKYIETFNCVVKSGQYQSGYWSGNNADGNSDHNFYCGPNNGSTNTYPGVRNVTIEGGELASMNGGRGTDDNSTNNQNNHSATDVINFYARIKGGIFNGSVFGGASDNPSNGSKKIVITGGTVRGWVAGGANGTGTGSTSSQAITYGDSYVYVGGNAIIGGNNVMEVNHTLGGQVFGAGRGAKNGSGDWQRASVYNSYVVIADGATITSGSQTNGGNVYGGGSLGVVETSTNIYVLGGTIQNHVFGGAYGNGITNTVIPTSNVYVRGGTVNGNVYGGSNVCGTVTNSNVTVSDCEKVTNVFGGGYGGPGRITIYTGTGGTNTANNVNHTGTNIGENTAVTVSGGTINNNVYGGGEEGTVTGNTNVTVSDGTMQNVYGAGLGTAYTGTAWPPTAANANIVGNTNVTVSGGVVNESVYGGGENGSVAFATGGATSSNSSTVSISGGQVKGDVFGGGREGTTQGRTIVNISGGTIDNNVYGGAYGKADKVYVAGSHTVNLMGNHAGGYPFIKGCVYGGSRLANDGQNLTLASTSFDNSNVTTLSSVINFSGGRVKEHVYAAGFYGRCFGSCYVNIGSLAVQNGPYNTDDKQFYTSNVYVQGTVWAGGDWGTFAGEFGKATITGNTNIYLDGETYNTESTVYTDENYMGIGSSVLGCGTSCDAGKADRHFVMRNYGKMKTTGATDESPVTGTTRDLYSAQLFTKVFIDDSHITFKGQGKMNDLNVTERYSLFEILDERDDKGGVYVLNGSTMVLEAPGTQLNSYTSGTCANTLVANPNCATLGRDALHNAHLDGNDNKVRVNNGSYIEVKYDKTTGSGQNATTTTLYGPVNGYTHMMTSVKSDEATCAYARPKNAENSPVATQWSNDNDGGFLSYDDYYNIYQEDGALVEEETDVHYELPYENHAPTRNDNEYFRVWRYGAGTHYVEGIVNVKQVGEIGDENTADYLTVDVTVQLPAWRASDAYYRFDRTGDPGSYYTLIDYGTDVLTYNAASYGEIPIEPNPEAQPATPGNWMYFGSNAQETGAGSADCPEISKLAQNPDQNFGLIIMPGTAMESDDEDIDNYIICSSSDSYIAENMQYNCSNYMKMPTVTFRLTYKNSLSSNTTWDPVTIPLVQCLADGTPKETVYITLTVSTETMIESTFNTQLYATMQGDGTSKHKRLQGTIVLPTFDTDVHPAEAMFYVESAKFTQGKVVDNSGTPLDPQSGSVLYKAHTADMDINSFGLTVVAVPTPDIMDDWRKVQPEFECGPIANGQTRSWDYHTIPTGAEFGEGFLGYAGGRNGLSIGFNLYYSDFPSVIEETLMGTLEIGIMFTHYAEGEGTDKVGHFKVLVQVYRRGEGANFYVDGINGTDDTQEGRGKYPNYAAKSVEFVLSRLGYKPGDNIFVVNTVSINKPLKWDGSKKQDDVNIWRYPGNHGLKSDAGDIAGNTLNNAFTGVLFNVNKKLTLTSIKVDGIYHEATASTHRPLIFPTTPNPSTEGSVIFDGKADAPLFVVNADGELHLRNVTKLLYNYNGNAGLGENATLGGAVWVKKGGLMTMNETANITGNINANGGGVYMDGGMVVSNDAYVFNNFKAPASAKATQEQSNVWLTKGDAQDMYKVVQIGLVDDQAYNQLLSTAKIGIDKEYSNDAYKMDDYLPVVYTAPSTIEYLEEPYNANRANAGEGIIVHDKAKYKLEKYTPNNYLYWLSTWVTFQDHRPNHSIVDGVDEGGWDGVGNIHTPQQLAWFISLVNGENGATASTFANDSIINITDDISMDGHVWVPIGTPTHPFKGTFEGNGHVITDMYGSLIQTNMGMFGYTEGATIQDAVMSTRFTGTNDNLGTVVGTMNNGTLSNVEGAGSITNKYTEGNMGGLVGNNVGGTIHSSFAVADMTGGANMGGLVGKNTGNLYNAYSNVNFAKADGQTANMTVGGLAYENTGTIENCYVVEGDHTGGTFNAFAAKNTGNIKYCYAAEGTTNYVGSGNDPVGNGTYGTVIGVKEIGYMYGDNLIATGTNTYVGNSSVTDEEGLTTYVDNHIPVWNGLLSALNQWVRNTEIEGDFSSWNRPITTAINGDLPVLAFPKDNAMGSTDGKFLKYTAFSLTHTGDEPEEDTFNNGIDGLLEEYNALENGGSIFHYGKATEVAKVPGSKVKVTINEDAVLLQAANAGNFTATVGVTFDNSDKGKHSFDYLHNKLDYDWHFMSSSLSDAPMGIEYGDATGQGGDVSISSMVGNYFPNGLPMALHGSTKWDLYTYYEPEYHWINLKRRGDDHWHTDNANKIQYLSGQEGLAVLNNETIFVPGKGYMMAISQDSYLSSTGTLNKLAQIALTNAEPLDPEYNKGWNLVGNPFQAYLDLDLVADAVAGPFYVYDAEIGNYVAYAVGQSMNTATPSRYIHPHQAFFMKASSNTITFVPTMATATKLDDSYFRGDEQVNYPLVNLFVENERGNRDLAVIEFNRPEIGGATKVSFMNSATFSVAAHLEGGTYGLLFVPEGTERVPVYFGTEESGTFTITWDKQNGDFTSLLLVDNMTGTITDMLRSDSYTFDATTDDYASRFYITYRVTAVDENVDGDGTFAFFDGSAWVVEGKGMLDVVDVLGRTLYSERLVNDRNRVSLNGMAAGVYLLRVSDGTNTMVQKIVVR